MSSNTDKTTLKDYNGSDLIIEPYGNNALITIGGLSFLVNKDSAKEIVTFLSYWFRKEFAEIDQFKQASTPQVEQLQNQIESLKQAINQDETGLAKGLSDVREYINGFRWILEGRGPYAYDDERYKDEVANIINGADEIALKALQQSGVLANNAFNGLFAPEPPPLHGVDVKKVVEVIKGKRNEYADTNHGTKICIILDDVVSEIEALPVNVGNEQILRDIINAANHPDKTKEDIKAIAGAALDKIMIAKK